MSHSPLITLFIWSQFTQSQLQSLYPIAAAFAIGGLLVGLILMWLILRVKISSLRVQHEEQSRSSRKKIAELEASAANLDSELSELHGTESILLKRQGELEASLTSHKRRHEEQQKLLNNMEEHLANSFRTLSNEALKSSREQFLSLAQETLKSQQEEAQGAFEKRHRAVEELIQPVAESLEKVQSRVGEMEAARENAYGSLLEQVKELAVSQASLNQETHRLTRALRQPSGHGQWGEIQLKRCVELAGMQEHCEFVPSDGQDNLRPDLVVRLPLGQRVIVDSKAPTSSFLEALEAENDSDADTHLVRHAEKVSQHIDHLASGSYRQQFDNKLEFVVLFFPSEAFFSSALNQDPSLIEKGVERGVILATPTTLIALLRAVAYGWRQENLAENARQILALGGDLYQRLNTLTERFGSLGHALDHTVAEYNEAMASLKSDVLPGAHRFHELGAPESAQPLGELPRLQITGDVPSRKPETTPFPAEEIDFATPRNTSSTPSSEDRFEGFVTEPEAKDDGAPENDSGEKAKTAADDLRAALDK
jgi:DNA recombination protein RmuC